jgi:hypothetical protein
MIVHDLNNCPPNIWLLDFQLGVEERWILDGDIPKRRSSYLFSPKCSNVACHVRWYTFVVIEPSYNFIGSQLRKLRLEELVPKSCPFLFRDDAILVTIKTSEGLIGWHTLGSSAFLEDNFFIRKLAAGLHFENTDYFVENGSKGAA